MTKCVASYSQRRLGKAYISHLYSSKRHFTRPPLLTRRSALVLKVGVSYGWKITKRVRVNLLSGYPDVNTLQFCF